MTKQSKSSVKRASAMLLALLMLMTLLPGVAMATGFPDTGGHWAADVIDKWAAEGYGILNGDPGGTFRPDDPIKRGEFAAVLNRIMKYATTAQNVFTDLNPNAFYYSDILKLNAAGVINGTSATTIAGDNFIKREQAFAMLARMFGVPHNEAGLSKFSDAAQVSGWAKGEVGGMAALGYVQGSDGKLNPLGELTRAQAVQALDNIIKGIYSKADTYTVDTDGIVIVNAHGVTLQNSKIGALYVTQGIGADGDFTLKNSETGRMVVTGGGEHSITIENSKVTSLTVSVDNSTGDVRIHLSDGSEVSTAEVPAGSTETVYFTNDEGTVVGSITVGEDGSITVSGEVGEVNVTGDNANVTVAEGASVGSLNIEGGGAKLDVAGKIDTLNVKGDSASVTTTATAEIKDTTISASGAAITGDGKVTNVTVTEEAGEGNKITTPGTTIENKSEVPVAVDDEGGTVDSGEIGTAPGELPNTEPEPEPSPGTPSVPGKSTGGILEGDATPVTKSTVTYNSITATKSGTLTCSTSQTIEYALSESNSTEPNDGWKDELEFTGLDPDTEYYVWARAKENSSYYAGTAIVVSAAISTAPLTSVTYSAEQVGGDPGTATTTGIKITFSEEVSDLDVDNITIDGAKTGELTNNGDEDNKTWLIGISEIKVENGQTITIDISDFPGFDVTTTQQSVIVYRMTTYTVSYFSDEGSYTPESQSVDSGGTITTAPTAPTKAGNVFAGWYSDTAKTIEFKFGESGTGTEVNGDMTLYAKWQPVVIGKNATSVTASSSAEDASGNFTITIDGQIMYNQNVFKDQLKTDFAVVLAEGDKPAHTAGGLVSDQHKTGAFTAISINLGEILAAKGVGDGTSVEIVQTNDALKVYTAYSADGTKTSSHTVATLKNEKFNVLLISGETATLVVTPEGGSGFTITINTDDLTIGAYTTNVATPTGFNFTPALTTDPTTFAADTYAYTASVGSGVSSLKVAVEGEADLSISAITRNTTDVKAANENDGFTLAYGENEIVITVSSNVAERADSIYTYTVTRAHEVITPEPIANVNAPAYGGTPVELIPSVAGGYYGSVEWTNLGESSTFAAGTVYTARVTLNASTGYKFGAYANVSGISNFKIGGTPPTRIVTNLDTKLVFETDFTETATPTARIGDIAVSGYTGSPISGTPKVQVELTDAKFTVTEGQDVSSWFTTIPAGMKANIETTSTGNTAVVVFSGTPLATSNNIVMTASTGIVILSLMTDYHSGIKVEDNPNAKYSISAPTPVVLQAASNIGSDRVTLTWDATPNATSVKVMQSTNDGETWTEAAVSGDLTQNHTTIVSNLLPNTTYKFKVVVEGGARAGTSEPKTAKTNDAIVNVKNTTPFTPDEGTYNTIIVTLGGEGGAAGTFKTTLDLNNFSISGQTSLSTTDAWYFQRVNDTTVRLTLKSGKLASAETTVTVLATALETGGTGTTVSLTGGNFYAISGTLSIEGSIDPALGLTVEGKVIHLYASNEQTVSLANTTVAGADGKFTLPGLYPAGTYVLNVAGYPASVTNEFTPAAHVTQNVVLMLTALTAPMPTFTGEGIVGWTDGTNTGATYDVELYKGEAKVHTYENAISGMSALTEMHSHADPAGTTTYKVKVVAKKFGFTSTASGFSGTLDIGPVKSIANVTVDATSQKKVTWTLAEDGGAEPFKYTVRIFRKVGTAAPSEAATYYVAHGDGSKLELDLAPFLGGLDYQEAGVYTVTVQPMAQRDGNITAENGDGLHGSYTTLAYDGVQSSAAVGIPEVIGSVELNLEKSGLPGSTSWLVEPKFNLDSSTSVANQGNTNIIASSGVIKTGGSDIFAGEYTGYKVSSWQISGNNAGTSITAAAHASGTHRSLNVDIDQTDPLTVTAGYTSTGVYVAPYIIYGSADLGNIGDLTEGVDMVVDSGFGTTNKTVYFVTTLPQFSFKDNTRGGATPGNIDQFTYVRKAETGTAEAMWEVRAEVSTLTGLTAAVNNTTADPMITAIDVVAITADIKEADTSEAYKFSDANLNRGTKLLTIDGNSHVFDFGLFFGAVQNVTVKNLKITIPSAGLSKVATATQGGGTPSAVLFEGGENITLDGVTISLTTTNENEPRHQAVYIGAAVNGTITITNSDIRVLTGNSKRDGNDAAIYIAAGAFDNVRISKNVLGGTRALVMNFLGATDTLTSTTAGNIKQNSYVLTSGNNDSLYQCHVGIYNLVKYEASTGTTPSGVFGTLFGDEESGMHFTLAEHAALKTLLTNLQSDKEGELISGFKMFLPNNNAAGKIISHGYLSFTSPNWNVTSYTNNTTLPNETNISDVNYDAKTGTLEITTVPGEDGYPTGATIDVSKFVLGGIRLEGRGTVYVEDSNLNSAGDWYWNTSDSKLTIMLTTGDKSYVDQYLISNKTFLAESGWSTATGYSDASTVSGVVPVVTNLNETGFTSATYNTSTGILTITTTETMPSDAVVDTNKIVLGKEGSYVRLSTEGYAKDADSTLAAGEWSWSGSTLQIKLTELDKASVLLNCLIKGNVDSGGSTEIYADADWNTSNTYTNAASTGVKTLDIAGDNVNNTTITGATYNRDTGTLVIDTTGTPPTGVQLKQGADTGILLFGTHWIFLNNVDAGNETYSYTSGTPDAGKWSWSGNKLTIVFVDKRKNWINGGIAAAQADNNNKMNIQAHPGWNYATGYTDATAVAPMPVIIEPNS